MAGTGPDRDLAFFLAEAVRRGGVDFHLHSSFSDGAQSPEEILDQVLDHGLWAFSLTDHDSMAGIPVIREALGRVPEEKRPLFIPGVELSAFFEGREVHILGYFKEDQPPPILAYLEDQARDRVRRNEAMVKKLRDLGYPIQPADLLAYGHRGTMIGRVHMALWLVDQAGLPSVKEAFTRLLGEGRPAFVYRDRRPVKDLVALIRQAGGLAVLAHPQEYGWLEDSASLEGKEELKRRFGLFKEAGIGGIECFHGKATREEAGVMQDLARSLDLICTAGSDSHGREDGHAPMYRHDWTP